MKAFVTGSTGLLGSHLVPELTRRGYALSALARSKAKAHTLFRHLSVNIVEGDIRRTESFEHHLEDCEVVFHLAAYFREYKATPAEQTLLHSVNVSSTIQLVEAARRQGVRTVVYVSSAGVLPPGATTAPPYNEKTRNSYFKSKIGAERTLLQLAYTYDDIRIIILRPSMMLGPQDLGPTPAGRFVRRFLEEKIPVIPPAHVLLSDVRDVAKALAEAAVRGQENTPYTLGGHWLRFEAFLKALETVSGVAAPTKQPPYALASIMLGVMGFLAPLTGKQPPLRRHELKRLRHLVEPDMQAAQRDLGYCCRPLRDTLEDTVQWFRREAGVHDPENRGRPFLPNSSV